MPSITKMLRIAAFIAGTGALAACDNAEDRAEAYYNKGLELVAAGEVDKAILEFRNALQLNQDAALPRLEYAKLLLEKRDFQSALGNFLRVAEIAPDNSEARINIGRMLIGANQIDAAEAHVDKAMELDGGNPEVQALKATVDYRSGRTEEGLAMARQVLEADPSQIAAAMVLVGDRVEAKDFPAAIRHVDAILVENPEELGLHLTRLSILEQIGDQSGVGDQLRDMNRLFPDNRSISTALVRWYVTSGDEASAETVLRETAARSPDDREAAMDVVRFLRETHGNDMALTELQRLTRRTTDQAFYERALAAFEFRIGDAHGAIKRVKDLLASGLEDTQEINDTKMTLADLLRRTGSPAGAQTLFDEVLEEDPENVEGLRLRALNALDQDRPENAITDLRAALNQEPQNATLMTILATAHERNGSPGLALERLALAVQASGNGVPEILRYANFLAKEEQTNNAETVLRDGLVKNPNAPELMAAMARLRLSLQDWAGAETMARQLEALGTDEAKRTANGIRVAAASGQQNFDQSIGLLRDMWAQSGEATTAMENLVRTYVQTGEAEKALEFLQGVIAEDPKNMRANLLLGAVQTTQGEVETAEATYRQVIADHPTAENGYTALSTLLRRLDRGDEADQVMRDGIENAPNSSRLLMTQAAREELAGNFDAAIAIYEQLYQANSSAMVLANNLASLISEHRTDQDSLDRAYAIAKRLRTSDVPAFQDTYGWILYNRGEYERAIVALKAAAEGLPDNALVQFHLGMAHDKLNQPDLAIAALERALELGQGLNLPQMEQAAAELSRIKGN